MSIPDFLCGPVVSSDCPGHSFGPWWGSFMCLAAWPKKKYLNCGLLTRGRRFQAEGTTRGIHQKDKKVQSIMEHASSYSGLLHCDDVASAGRGNCWWQTHRRPFCHAVTLDLCLMEKGLVIPRPCSGVWHAQICILFFCTWSIVNLQCCANLCYITKWLNYTHIDSLFKNIFSIMVSNLHVRSIPPVQEHRIYWWEIQCGEGGADAKRLVQEFRGEMMRVWTERARGRRDEKEDTNRRGEICDFFILKGEKWT